MNADNPSCVIAALDLSDDVHAVAERACLLASCLEVPARLVHIVDDAAIVNPANEFSLGGLVAGEFEEQEIEAELFARRYIESRIEGISSECATLEILTGRPAGKLEDHARETGALVIVVGQPESRFGSIVKHLTRHAPCDVHIVRVPER